MYNFVKFVTTKKSMKKIFFHLSLLLLFLDPGSEIRDPQKTYSGSRIPDPGVKKAPDPGSGSATLVASVLGSIPAPSDTVEPEGRQMKQC